MVPLFKHWRTTYERIDKFLSDKYFTDVNMHGRIIRDKEVLTKIYHLNAVTQPKLSCKDSPQLRDNSALTFDEIVSISEKEWGLIDADIFTFGPTWSVHWFKLCFCIPSRWIAKDHCDIELQWKSGCEVLVYSSSGAVINGLNATLSRISVPLSYITDSVRYGETYMVYMQVSCSDLFGAGDGGMIRPPSTNKMFQIETAMLALVSTLSVKVVHDLKLLMEIADALKETDRSHQALYLANEVVNTIVNLRDDDLDIKLSRALESMDKFFAIVNGGSQSTLHVMGHCHIDSAWLWRYGETRRKTARSWSTTLRLLERNPDMTFVCSQAQQLAWLKEDYPSVFVELQLMATKKQFLPAGGAWVEMDVNLPCCESLCRQFLYGQRFFLDNFSAYCKEFWLPDTFGYSPQLPQIMRQAKIARFMTQKLSWSLVNKFPHHTFWWRGIDGSQVLTHFPPGDSYSMKCAVSEMIHSAGNFSDKGRSSSMMYLYGHGDGGQGPTEEMLYTLGKLANCDGIPKIKHSSPGEFFGSVEDEDGDKLCTWVGELFLELHNGTYTTQRQIKKGNSHCEQLLRAVELLVCLSLCDSADKGGDQARVCVQGITDQLETKWKELLVNQFHDVLPGSSIEEVCDDAFWTFDSIKQWCLISIKELGSLLTHSELFFVNPTSWPLTLPVYSPVPRIPIGFSCIPPYTVSNVSVSDIKFPNVGYLYDSATSLHRLWNQFIEVCVDDHCRVTSLQLSSVPHLGNLLNGPANELFLYDDVPLFWDAWDVMDYHLETGTPLSSVASCFLKEKASLDADNIHATITCSIILKNSGTVIEKSVSIYAHLEYLEFRTKVIQWNEAHKFLKVKVPTRAITTEVHYRTQAGFITRPSHRNTSWDSAKFEVCSHEWVDIGEANWGVSVFKDAIFGSSVDGGSINLSLLRSPTSPDATADRKHLPHIFAYALYPHYLGSSTDKFATISAKASQFCWMSTWKESVFDNNLLSVSQNPQINCSFPVTLLFPLSGEVSIDWIKPSCDNHRAFILRIHEQIGGRHLVKMISQLVIHSISLTNVLEELQSPVNQYFTSSTNDIEFDITPFKIVSFVIEFQF